MFGAMEFRRSIGLIASVAALVVLHFPQNVYSYSMGAPFSACDDLIPQHRGAEPRTDPAPYDVSVVKKSGGRLTVVLNATGDAPFKGYLVQARKNDDQNGQAVGTFRETDLGMLLTCGSQLASAVTHKNSSPKKIVQLDWDAPPGFNGDVIFRSTFVKDKNNFWVGENSGPMAVKGPRPTSPPPTKTTPIFTDTPDVTPSPEVSKYTSCKDKTEGCFGFPDGCIAQEDCKILARWSVKGETYIFYLDGTSNGYIAMGLSNDEKMDRDSVTECVLNGNNMVDVYSSWNLPAPPRSNERLPNQDGVTRLDGSYTGGQITCSFQRDKITNISGEIFDLEKPYYVMLASGALDGDKLGYHGSNKHTTGEPISLASTEEVAGKSDILIRLHGAFMIAAWIGAASCGIFIARYFKQTWSGTQACGKDVWFTSHRCLMILVWALTIAAFVMIFVEIGGWSDLSEKTIGTFNPHAILGCVTTGLAFIQPFMAMLRPHPGASKRWLFNWAHWFVGNAAQICGIVAIFFALRLQKVQLPHEEMQWILVGFVAFHVLMHFIFSVMAIVNDGKIRKRTNTFPMKEMNSSRSPLNGVDKPADAAGASARKVLLALYLLGNWAITIVLILIVVLAPIDEFLKKHL